MADVPDKFDVIILALIGVGITTFEPSTIRWTPAVANPTFPLDGRYNPAEASDRNASEGALTLPDCKLLTAPGGPWIPPYERSVHRFDPFPILNLDVSVSIPISPDASVGFVPFHCAAVPLRNWSWIVGIVFLLIRNDR